MVTSFLKTVWGKKTSGDQLRAENPKLPKAFPQTPSMQRCTRKPTPSLRCKTQHQRDFIMFVLSKGFSGCSSHSQLHKSLHWWSSEEDGSVPVHGSCLPLQLPARDSQVDTGKWTPPWITAHLCFPFQDLCMLSTAQSKEVTVQCNLMILILGASS